MIPGSGWMGNDLNPNEFCYSLCTEYLINNNNHIICGMIANHKHTLRKYAYICLA